MTKIEVVESGNRRKNACRNHVHYFISRSEATQKW